MRQWKLIKIINRTIIICEFIKVTGYKIKIQKLSVVLYISSKLLENEKIFIVTSTEEYKIFRHNFNKCIQYLYTKNY